MLIFFVQAEISRLAFPERRVKVSESRQASAVEKDCDEMTEMKLANCQGRHL